MSNCSMNTHRREMRAVTPVARIGRNAAGAAIAAGLMVGGGSAALAEGQPVAAAPQVAPHEVPTAAVAIPTVTTDAAAAPAVYSTDNATALGLKATAPAAKKDETSTTSEKSSDSSKTRSARTSRAASDEDATSEKSASGTDERSSRKTSTSEDKTSEGKTSKNTSSKASDDSSEDTSSVAGGSIVSTARKGIGVPYVWAGSSRSGWDCSGFTSWVYAQHGIDLPHSASGQKAMGRTVSASEARPGDLVYTPGHIGIYAGNGQIIDAGRAGKTTSQRNMWSGASWTYVRIDR